ncbi:MAG: hypothetical protein KDD63_05535 [Bacteroidetes bacterium]|nr:hypothetical protein [Bacteroidota bacterium]MCB0847472.1 hypothetical protein [Bacteroidota bacterium]MCB0851659.1 hypothetical protein [Bacteroidota bacterium]
MKNYLILILLIPLQFAYSQDNRIKAGIELDVLPYLTGGYFAAGWVGTNQVRIRALIAKVNMPDFIVSEGFTNNKINSIAIVGDYFLKKDFQGLWLGSGFVLWQGDIQTDKQIETASYKSYLLNGSLGYAFYFNPRFYISPWAGLSLRIGGDKTISVDGENYDPPLINPELSVKMGFRFNK